MNTFVQVAVFVLATVVLCQSEGQTRQILSFTLAARNLPSGKNPYAEIKNPIQCLTEIIKDTQNPNWSKVCTVERFDGGDKNLVFDIRHGRTGLPDSSLGLATVKTQDMLEVGSKVTVGIYKDSVQVGTFEVTTTTAE